MPVMKHWYTNWFMLNAENRLTATIPPAAIHASSLLSFVLSVLKNFKRRPSNSGWMMRTTSLQMVIRPSCVYSRQNVKTTAFIKLGRFAALLAN